MDKKRLPAVDRPIAPTKACEVLLGFPDGATSFRDPAFSARVGAKVGGPGEVDAPRRPSDDADAG